MVGMLHCYTYTSNGPPIFFDKIHLSKSRAAFIQYIAPIQLFVYMRPNAEWPHSIQSIWCYIVLSHSERIVILSLDAYNPSTFAASFQCYFYCLFLCLVRWSRISHTHIFHTFRHSTCVPIYMDKRLARAHFIQCRLDIYTYSSSNIRYIRYESV